MGDLGIELGPSPAVAPTHLATPRYPMGSHSSDARELEIPARLSGQRLDAILAELCPERSKSALQKLVRRGSVEVDGKRVLRSNIRPGRRARIRIVLGQRAPEVREHRLEVVWEDEHLVVVDKPAGLLTHRKSAGGEVALADLAVARFGRLPILMGEERPGVVHRLDRETSGLILLARSGDAMEGLRDQFRERAVRKTYLALAHGLPREEQLILDWDLGPAAGSQDRQAHFPRGEGKRAETEVRLLERLGSCCILECSPRTGRRHQIRVHLDAAGLSIVGDKIYGAKNAPGLGPGAPHPQNHCLHASALAFQHPLSGEDLSFESKPRAEMLELIDWLRSH